MIYLNSSINQLNVTNFSFLLTNFSIPGNIIYNYQKYNSIFEVPGNDINLNNNSFLGYYVNSTGNITQCSQNLCSSYCVNGLYTNQNNFCHLCEHFIFKSTCVLECPDEYYNSSNQVCDICDSSCETCVGPFNNSCSGCKGNTPLFNSTYNLNYSINIGFCICNGYNLSSKCVSKCPNQYYLKDNYTCEECDNSCEICVGPFNNSCSGCKGNTPLFNSTYNLNYSINIGFCICNRYNFSSQCVSKCPNQYYLKDNNTCEECDNSCETCFGPFNNNCTKCKDNLTYSGDYSSNMGFCICDGYLLNSQCLIQCPDQYYFNENKRCQQCHNSCKTCNDAYNCTNCLSSYYFNGGLCLNDCPNSNFKNNETQSCSLCDHSCINCIGTYNNNCTLCDKETRNMTNYTFNSEYLLNVGICSCIPLYYDIFNDTKCYSIYFINI